MSTEGGNQWVRSPAEQHEFSRDTALEILSNQRRRFALHYLKRNQQRNGHASVGVPMRDVVDQVASWENDKPVEELTEQERKRVQNALGQFHVPKMTESGFVSYDAETGELRLTETAAKCDFYIDVVPERGISWGVYYLGLTGFSALCLLGILAGLSPFTSFSPFAWSVFFVTAFSISALGHFYDTQYRMRLGACDEPPEVTDR